MKTLEVTSEIIELELSKIDTNPANPRTSFPVAEMHELKESITQQGVIQPILVRPIGKRFELVYGERRLKGSELAGLKTIPARIRVLTDNEALEIAITENLQRADISPLDEAVAYKNLIEVKQYDIASLNIKFGKSETYIRSRMRLNDLIPEFVNLFADDLINIGSALELSKYGTDLQKEIFEGHFKLGSGWNNWDKLSTKELASNIEHQYTTRLSQYGFDKTDCQTCPFNSNVYQLFSNPESCGNCSMKSCLQQKNTTYMVEAALECLAQNPSLQFCRQYNTNASVVESLVELGHEVQEISSLKQYPEPPQAPVHNPTDKKKDVAEANAGYKRGMKAYKTALAEFEGLKEQDLITEYVRIGVNELHLCYMIITKSEDQNDAVSMIEKLEIKDKRNKEIANEKIIEESKALIYQAGCNGDFSTFEERLLYYFMLSSLKKSNYETFGIKQKWRLEYGDRMEILDALTDEIKTMIRRDFLVANLTGLHGPAECLILEFARQHVPDDLSAIEKVHNDTYTKRHDRLKERIDALRVTV